MSVRSPDLFRSLAHLAVAAALLGTGCGPAPETRPDPALYADTRARTLSSNGQHAAAAAEYLRIAGVAPSPDREQYHLAAAYALLAAADPAGARSALAHPAITGARSKTIRIRRQLLNARASLLELDAPGATAALATINPDVLPPYLAREARTVLAEAHRQTGDYSASAKERVRLELLLTQPQEIADNRNALWESLVALPRAELVNMRRAPPNTLGGWVELALLREQFLSDATGSETALAQWETAFPGHPATIGVVSSVRAEAQAFSKPATHIALLLPLSGQFAEAARAIRDGFLASWFAHGASDARPQISIYDTQGQDVATIHAQAVAAGADFVVGPLLKEAVEAILSADPIIPTLALNIAPSGDVTYEPGALYQFGLAPEGEAEQVAERAWRDGYKQAIMLAPQSPWGTRVSEAFRERWAALGGSISRAAQYGSDPNALANTVRSALNIDDSERRAKRLGNTLGRKIEHEPRRRQDVDVIFLAGFPRQARQLRPQIDFFRASAVPVYATSHVYSGKPDPNADGDINGIVFGDMPWVLGGGKVESGSGALRERMFGLWPGAQGSFTRYYAFGADAERLVGELRRLRARPDAQLPGYTGMLSVSADQRVRRWLQWAIFDDGIPKPYTAPDDR